MEEENIDEKSYVLGGPCKGVLKESRAPGIAGMIISLAGRFHVLPLKQEEEIPWTAGWTEMGAPCYLMQLPHLTLWKSQPWE